jgi:hypothetical protein
VLCELFAIGEPSVVALIIRKNGKSAVLGIYDHGNEGKKHQKFPPIGQNTLKKFLLQ